MARYVFFRLAQLLPVLFLASIGVWLMIYLIPGDPALALLGADATPEQLARTRVLMGLLALDKKHASDALEQACKIALSHGAFRLRTVRKLIARRSAPQQALPFLVEHPIIRPLDDYGAVVARAIERQPIILRMSPAASGKEGFLRHGGANECVALSITSADEKASLHRTQSEAQQRVIHPPRSGYPLSGCTSAEPDSVSPDSSSIASSFHQEI